LGWSRAPPSHHRSLFTLGVCFPPIQTCANVCRHSSAFVSSGWTLISLGPTRHTLYLTVSVYGQLFQHFQYLCHCWMRYHALEFACFPKSALWHSKCPYHVQLLAECEDAAGLRLLHSLQKT
jgi:hypothetical protein